MGKLKENYFIAPITHAVFSSSYIFLQDKPLLFKPWLLLLTTKHTQILYYKISLQYVIYFEIFCLTSVTKNKKVMHVWRNKWLFFFA